VLVPLLSGLRVGVPVSGLVAERVEVTTRVGGVTGIWVWVMGGVMVAVIGLVGVSLASPSVGGGVEIIWVALTAAVGVIAVVNGVAATH
jgi:hypothetical protein